MKCREGSREGQRRKKRLGEQDETAAAALCSKAYLQTTCHDPRPFPDLHVCVCRCATAASCVASWSRRVHSKPCWTPPCRRTGPPPLPVQSERCQASTGLGRQGRECPGKLQEPSQANLPGLRVVTSLQLRAYSYNHSQKRCAQLQTRQYSIKHS